MEEKTEFALSVDVKDGRWISNVDDLTEQVETALKKYGYIVQESDYDKALKDRAALNKMTDRIKAERMRIEKQLMDPWKDTKTAIMDLEKKIKGASDSLDKGIKEIDAERAKRKASELENHWIEITEGKYDFSIVWKPDYTKKKYKVEDLKKEFDAKATALDEGWKTAFSDAHQDTAYFAALEEYHRHGDLAQAVMTSTRVKKQEEQARIQAEEEARRKAEIEARRIAEQEARVEAQEPQEKAPVIQPDPDPIQTEQPPIWHRRFEMKGTPDQYKVLWKCIQKLGMELMGVEKLN